MTVEPVYRINLNPDEPDYANMEVEYWVSDTEGRDAGWLVPDSRLQAIADVWNEDSAHMRPLRNFIRADTPKWAVLLDALIEDGGEVNQDMAHK